MEYDSKQKVYGLGGGESMEGKVVSCEECCGSEEKKEED